MERYETPVMEVEELDNDIVMASGDPTTGTVK